MSGRPVFFVSDQTGVTAETMGHSLLTQFEGLEFRAATLPFVSSVDKAKEALRRIRATGEESGLRPIVFGTLVQDDIREVFKSGDVLFLDFFESFVGAMERELGSVSTHSSGRAHGIADSVAYATRIDATNYALANDDGSAGDYSRADVILIGVSRSGKTPTCLYLAMQYGIYAANYPLTDEDLESTRLPPSLQAHKGKLFGLRIAPARLQQIRQERRAGSRYASAAQVAFETRAAEALFHRHGIASLDTTECSIEEISARILEATGVERRVRP
ncbi:MAG: pyruvate, water dikinase regulatory protein [Gammaproteobacteria bacterium]